MKIDAVTELALEILSGYFLHYLLYYWGIYRKLD